MSGKTLTHIYGFEDYSIISIQDYCFYFKSGFSVPWYYNTGSEVYLINKDLPVDVRESSYSRGVEYSPYLCTEHKELLDIANKVFVHSSCNISRTVLSAKYKKTLNPWMADIVVIPKPDENTAYMDKVALFIDEETKTIVKCSLFEPSVIELVKSFNEGDMFCDWATCQPNSYDRNVKIINSVMNSKFFYTGELITIPKQNSYVLDILTRSLPTDKIVYEDSLQDTLGDEANKLTLDSLTSIGDMLNSSDSNTVATGLKALSMMDWMHYPNSVRLMITDLNNRDWRFNKACNSTSVKYMFKTLSGSTNRRRWPGGEDASISKEDFELYKQLKMHREHLSEKDVMSSLYYASFITCNGGMLVPRFK